MEWILVIFIYVGPLSKNDSVALTNVPGFQTLADCNAAGEISKKLIESTTKDARFVCLQRKLAK